MGLKCAKLLNNYGFTYVFENGSHVNVNAFITQFKDRVIDTYKTEWFRSLESSSILDMYKIFKSSLLYETYLDYIPRHLRSYLTKLRLSVLPLRIQTGRYNRNNIPRNQRYCLCCQQDDLEDEFHFVCICPCFLELRKKYIKRFLLCAPICY